MRKAEEFWFGGQEQGVVTPIGAVLTGTRQGHRPTEVFSFQSRGHYGFSRRLVILWRTGL